LHAQEKTTNNKKSPKPTKQLNPTTHNPHFHGVVEDLAKQLS